VAIWRVNAAVVAYPDDSSPFPFRLFGVHPPVLVAIITANSSRPNRCWIGGETVSGLHDEPIVSDGLIISKRNADVFASIQRTKVEDRTAIVLGCQNVSDFKFAPAL
jgi:hypothetical protein